MPKNRPEPSKGQVIQPPPKKRRQLELILNENEAFASRDLEAEPSVPSLAPHDVSADDEYGNTNNNNNNINNINNINVSNHQNDNDDCRSLSPADRFGGRYSELTRGFTNYLTSLSSTSSSAILSSHAAPISSASHDDGRKFSVGDTSKESGAQYGSSCLTGPSDTLQNDSPHTCPEYSAPEVGKSGASPTSRAMDARKHDGSGDVSDSATDISDDSESKPKPSGDQRPREMTKEEKKASYVSRRTCSYCGKVCFKPSDLQRHLLVHTGERPHKCEFCSRAFKSKGSLLYHRRVNHEASDTSLSVCLQEKYLRHKQSLAKRMRKAESKKEALQSYKILRSHLEGTTEPRTSTMMEGNFDNLLSLVGGSRIDLENSVAYQTFAPLIPNGDTDTSLDSFRLALANQERYSDYGGEQDSRSGSVDDAKSTTTSTPVTSPLLGLATVASSIDRLASTRLQGNDEKYHHHDDHVKRERFYDDRKWFQNAPIEGGGAGGGGGGGVYPTLLRETLQKKCCSETGVCPGHCRTEVDGDVTCSNRRDDVIKADDLRESENGSGSDESELKSMTNLRETRIFSLVEGLEGGQYVCFHKCHLCGKRLASLSLIRKHLANHSVTWRRCPVCHTTFKFRANLLRHLESEHEIKCESLSKAEDLSAGRDRQRKSSESMEIVHNDLASQSHITGRLNSEQRESKRKEGIFKCRYCRKTFFRLYCLQRHERVHTGVKTCFCRKCGRGFSELRNLRHHILRFHSGLDRAELIKMLSNGSGPKKSETESICKKFIITSSQVAKHTMAGTVDSLAKPKVEVQEAKSDLRKELPVFYPDLYLTSSYPMSVGPMSYPGLPPVPVFDRAPPIFPVVDYGRYHPLLSPTTTVPSTSAGSAVTPSSSTNHGLSRVLISPTRLASLTYVPPQPSPDGKPDTRSLASSSPSPTESDLKKKGNNFSKHSSRLDIVRDAVKTEAAYQPVMSLDGRSVYKCPYCPKTFVGASDLTRHLNFHADLRPYKCELCEYSAKTNSQLKVHMRRHQGIREFKCTLCNYEGVTRSDLNRHFRSQTHINLTVEKQYQGLDANGGSQSKSGAEAGLDLSKPWRQQSSNHYSKHQFRCAACEFEGHSQEDLRQHLLSETHINKMVKKHDLKMAELPVKQEVPIQPTLSMANGHSHGHGHSHADSHGHGHGHAERPSVVSWRPRPDSATVGHHQHHHHHRHDASRSTTTTNDAVVVHHKSDVLKFDFRVVEEARADTGETRVNSCLDTRARGDHDSGHGAGREVPNHHENSDTEEEQLPPTRVIVIDT